MSEQQTKGPDEMFCSSCGAIIKKEAEICPRCGVRIRPAPYYSGDGEGRDWLLTLLLCIFLGWVGIHRFYTGSTAIGVVQLLTFGCCGVWTLIDLIMIVVGSYRDGDGKPLVRKI